MIISHKYKFIFIKTKKTAGTSIEVFLSQHCAKDDIVTPIIPHVKPHYARNHQSAWNPIPELLNHSGNGFIETMKSVWKKEKYYNHIPAKLVKQRVTKDIWNEYFKFCVERNPWDKTLSHYHMINDRSEEDISLDEYFDTKDFCINYPTYTDNNNNVLVDKVIKYESLAEELQEIFDELGIPFNGSLGVNAKSEHRKDRRHYQEVLTEEQGKIIEENFEKEIKMHGYKF